jgi:hypothetical protein
MAQQYNDKQKQLNLFLHKVDKSIIFYLLSFVRLIATIFITTCLHFFSMLSKQSSILNLFFCTTKTKHIKCKTKPWHFFCCGYTILLQNCCDKRIYSFHFVTETVTLSIFKPTLSQKL